MGKNDNEKSKDIVSPGGTVMFSEMELGKLIKENMESKMDLFSYFSYMVDTVQDPWEVWGSKENGVGCLKFIKLYEGGIGCVVKAIKNEDDKFVIDDYKIFTKEQADELDAQRCGIALLYVNNDLVEQKKDI